MKIKNKLKKLVTCYLSLVTRPNGQTLIETVIALAVVLILVSALLSVSISSVRSASLSRNKNAAAQLAYTESELVRNLRDNPASYGFGNWAGFSANFAAGGVCNKLQQTPCNVDETSLLFNSGTKLNSSLVLNTIFTISLNGEVVSSQVNYTVTVSWSDSLGPHTETVSSILTPWK